MKQVLAFFLLVTLYANTAQIGAFRQDTKSIEDNFCKQLKNEQKFCMEYKVEYPIVSGSDMKVVDAINTAIKKQIPTSTDAQKYVTNYLKENNGEAFSSGHSDETKIKILSITARTFTLVVSSSSYTGGAHGIYGSSSYNYDKYTGEPISLDGLFRPNYKESFRVIAERVYRDQNGLMPHDDLVKTQDWFNNKFVLPESIGLGSDGLHLDYMPYEIKAFAFGITSFVIPYDLLTPIAKPNSYLRPLINSSSASSKSNNIEKVFDQSYEATINFKAKLLSNHRLQIDVDTTNLTSYRSGGLSLSFPQLKYKNAVIHKEQRGFNKINIYPVGSRLYYAPTKKTIRGQYLLVESDSKKWHKNQAKSISLILTIPRDLDNLYINIRAAFRKKRNIIAVPYSGAEDQQGFHNYRIKIPM